MGMNSKISKKPPRPRPKTGGTTVKGITGNSHIRRSPARKG